MKLSRESLAAWRELPMTEVVLRALNRVADQNEAAFKEEAWAGVGPERLSKLRATVDAYRDVAGMFDTETAAEDVAAMAGMELEA